VRAEVLDEHASNVGVVVDDQDSRTVHGAASLQEIARGLWSGVPDRAIPCRHAG